MDQYPVTIDEMPPEKVERWAKFENEDGLPGEWRDVPITHDAPLRENRYVTQMMRDQIEWDAADEEIRWTNMLLEDKCKADEFYVKVRSIRELRDKKMARLAEIYGTIA